MVTPKKKSSLNVMAPETLPDRPILAAHTYESVGEGYSLDNVGVSFTSAKGKKNTYKAPTGDSDVAATIRDYVLIRSRYDLPYADKRAKQWDVLPQAVETSNRILANVRYQHTFDSDPSIGTVESDIIAAVLNEGNPPKQVFLAAMSHIGTVAYEQLCDKITDPDIKNALYATSNEVLEMMYGYHRLAKRLPMLNSPQAHQRRWAVKWWKDYVQNINALASNSTKEAQERRSESKRKGQKPTSARSYPKREDLLGNWEQLVVAKPELSINHTGKLGRRTIANDSGREPRFINRMVTDPDRRIFSRKTRALGGVVVIDASGSMQLSEEDLDRLLKCSTGATVVMYSGGHNDPRIPNTWVVARKGRMVRTLPDVPGNNCVDGPALIYGASLRERSSQPLIWVSDGEVTGARGNSSPENLRKDIAWIKRKYRVQQVMDVPQAEKLMKRLQGGKR